VLLFVGAAVAGWRAFTPLINAFDVDVQGLGGVGAGGLGAVSVDFTSVVLEPLLCLIANRVSKKWVLRRGGWVRTVHRAHSFALLALVLLSVAGLVAAVAMPDASRFEALFIVWGGTAAADVVQLLLLAALLVLLGMPQPRPAAGGA
jgi:hypothetical protein